MLKVTMILTHALILVTSACRWIHERVGVRPNTRIGLRTEPVRAQLQGRTAEEQEKQDLVCG